ncbi:hypothetical protein [Candidatus Poriferisodalis sp.]|uniref:hypothetical protein n=1 Tax=Candidatus Poriferisodalis sp. TaxID=3101277 RepID=UPI003B021078
MVLSAVLAAVPPPAAAEETPRTVVWSSTLDVQTILDIPNVGWLTTGCQTDNVGEDSCTTDLTDSDFTYDGVTYQVDRVQVNQDGKLLLTLDQPIPSKMRRALRLTVNGKPYNLGNGNISAQVVSSDSIEWPSSAQTWAEDDNVRLGLSVRDFPTVSPQPFDHSVQPVPPSGRVPQGQGAGAAFCYSGAGNGTTTMGRNPDGTAVEVPDPGPYIRSRFAC